MHRPSLNLSIFLVLLTLPLSPGASVELTDSTWESTLRDHTNVLVLFHGKDCSKYVADCSHLVQRWSILHDKVGRAQLSHESHDGGGLSGITVAVLDGDLNPHIRKQFKVNFYPQVIFFHNYPSEMYAYRTLVLDDDDTVDTMIKWMELIMQGALRYTAERVPSGNEGDGMLAAGGDSSDLDGFFHDDSPYIGADEEGYLSSNSYAMTHIVPIFLVCFVIPVALYIYCRQFIVEPRVRLQRKLEHQV
jgi:hypothetical protein